MTLNTTHQNHEGEVSYDEANRLLRAVTTEGEGLFKTNVWFVVKAETFEDLNDKTLTLIKLLKEQGAIGYIESDGLDYYFNHMIMGVPPTMKKAVKTNAAYLSNLVPYTKESLHEKGLEVFSSNGHQMFIDLYDGLASNQNWLITGGSGEGKSFFAATFMQYLYENCDAKIGIFDLGGSLKRMALYLGGEDLSERINPLQFRCPHYLKRFIVSVLGEGELSRQDEGHLFELLEEGLLKDIRDFKELIGFVSMSLEGISYYFSELWQYFTDEIIVAPDVFYLDTKGIPEKIIAPYLVFAKELSERQEGRIVNFYDECWDILDKCPEVMRTNAKTSRKNLIGNLFLTQEIVELTQDYGNVASAIIGNTNSKLYFHQLDLGHPILSEFEKSKIKQVKSKKEVYSEFLYSSPNYKKIVRLIASPLIYEICNTEGEQVKRQQDFIDQFEGVLSYKEAMDKWVRVIYD